MEASKILKQKDFTAVAVGCAGAMRVIGQALEDLHINEFSLKTDGKTFVVNGTAEARAST